MNYIENIYVCLAAPVIIAILCMGKNHRRTISFLLCGMTICLLSSYISTFLAAVQHLDPTSASIHITPIVEEVMKFLPVLFYLVVFEPNKHKSVGALLMSAIGFATFENVCYLIQNGADKLLFLLVRGFGAGTMHVVCGLIMAIGLLYLWNRDWLRAVGLFGLLAVAITYHSIYNLMVSQTGAVAFAGYLIPILTAVVVLFFKKDIIRLRGPIEEEPVPKEHE